MTDSGNWKHYLHRLNLQLAALYVAHRNERDAPEIEENIRELFKEIYFQ